MNNELKEDNNTKRIPLTKHEETEAVMLTTEDNPFNPFTQYNDWLAYDEHAKYYTNSYLARVCITSPGLSDSSQQTAIRQAMDEIVKLNLSGGHMILTEEEAKIRKYPSK